jgi:hypothetical protein
MPASVSRIALSRAQAGLIARRARERVLADRLAECGSDRGHERVLDRLDHLGPCLIPFAGECE